MVFDEDDKYSLRSCRCDMLDTSELGFEAR